VRKTINTRIVGLPYAEFDNAAVQALREGRSVRLSREPDNPYDSNAVAAFIGSKKIGFIRKPDAAILSPAMLQAGTNIKTIIESRDVISLEAKSLKIAVEVYSETPVPERKDLIESDAGIYRITVMAIDKCYIGQANKPARRIREHWNELTLGVHTNRDLQRFWSMYGSETFRVELVEKAPQEQSPLARQRWLAEKERYWIDKERKSGRSLNVLDGDIVATPAARAELIKEEADHDRRVKQRKREIAAELKALDEKIRPELNKRRQHTDKLENINALIRNHTGIRGFFKGHLGVKELERLEDARYRCQEMLRHVEPICTELLTKRDNLFEERKSLKTTKQRNRAIDRALLKYGVSARISRSRFY